MGLEGGMAGEQGRCSWWRKQPVQREGPGKGPAGLGYSKAGRLQGLGLSTPGRSRAAGATEGAAAEVVGFCVVRAGPLLPLRWSLGWRKRVLLGGWGNG